MIPHFKKGDFEKLMVPVHSDKDTQRAIGNIYLTLSKKIELNRRMNQTLEKIAQAIFKSWFIDFDPVHAKAERRDTGLPKEIADLFPDRFKDSELGEIPKGWVAGSLQDMSFLNAHNWTAKTLPNEVRYVDLTNVKNGSISAAQQFDRESAPSRARRILQTGDTIVGTVRPGNRSFAFIGSTEEALTGSTGFAVLTPSARNAREFVYLVATRNENIARLERLADGAAYPAVRPVSIAETECVVPSEKVMNSFHSKIRPLFEKVHMNVSEARLLSEIRDTFLPKLISGDFRIPNLDGLLEDIQ